MEDKTWKIIAVSPTPAKPYTNNFGTTYYRDVRLADEQGNEHAKPVSLGKKSEDAFVVGAELFGHIFVEQGRPTDKFKAASKQQGSFGGGFSQPASSGSSGFSGSSSKPAYKDNSDGQRQGMCFNNAAAYINSLNKDDALLPEAWAKGVYAYANALYKLGDLGQDGGTEVTNPKAPTSKPWQINGRDTAAKLWPSEHQVDTDAEAASLYATIASAEEFPEADLPPGVF